MQSRTLAVISVTLLLMGNPCAWAQAPRQRLAEKERIEALERSNLDLRKRLDALEQQPAPSASPSPSVVAKEASPPSSLPGLGLGIRNDIIRASFQFFGNSDFYYEDDPDNQGAGTSFAAGALDFFATAEVADRFQMLTEVVAEGDSQDNDFHFELERLWGSWAFADALYIKFGREHSAVTRWDRMYHHGRWLWPSATAPFQARFEDEGGPLPIHQVGIEIGGTLQGALGSLGYIAALSNGRGRQTTEITNFSDPNEAKAYELALTVSPHLFRGFSWSGTFYADEIPKDAAGTVRTREMRELIGSTWMTWNRFGLEVLGEGAAIAHKDRSSGRTFQHAMGYLHVGFRINDWTPYLRFDARGMERGDLFYDPTGIDRDAWEQAFGVRYDLLENVVVKVEGALGRGEGDNSSKQHSQARCAVQLAWVF